MNVVCPACERLFPLSDFRLDGDGEALVVRCTSCQVETRVRRGGPPASGPPSVGASALDPAEPAAASAFESHATDEPATREDNLEPFRVPPGYCPKCVTPISPGAVSCASCGLTFAKFDPRTVELSERLQSRWLELLQRSYRDEGAHESLRRALDAEELAALGRLYRIRLALDAEDAMARKGRERVLELVVERAAATSTLREPSESGKTLKNALAILVILCCLVALVVMGSFVLRSFKP